MFKIEQRVDVGVRNMAGGRRDRAILAALWAGPASVSPLAVHPLRRFVSSRRLVWIDCKSGQPSLFLKV